MFFYQLHEMFGRIYEILDGQEDGFAEQARGCGIEIPASVFNSVPEVEWETPKDLLEELLKLAKSYESRLRDLHRECEDSKKLGFVNLIEGFLTEVDSIKFLLSATLDNL